MGWEIITNNITQIIIAILIGLLFFLLTPIWGYRVKKREKQMKEQTLKEKILDLLEERIINNQIINSSIISSLLNSLEREYKVLLDLEYDHVAVLEDLELRFEKTKRPKDEKEKYNKKIEKIIQQIEKEDEEEEEKRRPFSKLLKPLKESIKKGDKKESLSQLSTISKRLVGEPEEREKKGLLWVLDVYIRMYKKSPTVFIIASIIVIILYILFFQWVLQIQ